MSNLSSTGESHFANPALTNSPYTTNRILEIPQDIKFELANNSLKLKAGSKVYVPNGFEQDGTTPKFDVVTIASDLTMSTPLSTTSGKGLLFIKYDSLSGVAYDIDICSTGTTDAGNNTVRYRTDTNFIVRTTGGGAKNNYSFPIALINMSGTTYVSIDKIFNGFGEIGSTAFLLPGVKVEYVDPNNGMNPDGTYNVKTATNDIVRTSTTTVTAGTSWTWYIQCDSNGIFTFDDVRIIKNVKSLPSSDQSYIYVFNETDGKWYGTGATTTYSIRNYAYIPVTTFSTDSNHKITSFAPYNINTVNTYSRSELSGMGMPSSKYEDWTLGASGATYTAPANGYVTLQKQSTAANQMISIYTLATDTHTRTGYRIYSNTSGDYLLVTLPVKKGESVNVTYNSASTTGQYFRFVYAEGEN